MRGGGRVRDDGWVTRAAPRAPCRSADRNMAMQMPPSFRRVRFSIRTLFVVTTLVGLYLGVAPRIQDAREAWRRSRLHYEVGPEIYGLHNAHCEPCRRRMVRAICDETQSPQVRVAWINDLARNAKADETARQWLVRASESPTQEVATAARDALTVVSHRLQ